MGEYYSWEITIDTTKAAFERFGRAVVLLGARVGRSLCFGKPGRGVSAIIAVELREGTEARLDEVCKPYMRTKLKVAAPQGGGQ